MSEGPTLIVVFNALQSYLLKHGRTDAFYSDKHTVFRVSKPSQHMTDPAFRDLTQTHLAKKIYAGLRCGSRT